MRSKNIIRNWIVAGGASLLISACGGGGGGDGDEPNDQAVVPEANVALAVNGGVASASYDTENAGIVNDGDIDFAGFWSGNVDADYVNVTLNKTYAISSVRWYTNAVNNINTRLQLSTDGVTYQDVSLFGGGDVACQGIVLSNPNDYIDCDFFPPQIARHVRVVVFGSSGAAVGAVQIAEIQAWGK